MTTEQARARLMQVGRLLVLKLPELMAIVTDATFCKRGREKQPYPADRASAGRKAAALHYSNRPSTLG